MDSPLKKHIQDSPKLQELRSKRKLGRRRLAILLSLLFCTIASACVFFAHYPRWELTTIVVRGNQIISTEDIKEKVESDLRGNYAYIFPHRNAFLYPKKKIAADLAEAFPRLKNIAVYRTSLGILEVDLAERRGYALWCGGDTTADDASKPCYFTDDTGKIISTAPYYSGNMYPRFFGGNLSAAETNPLGKTFIDSALFERLLAFRDRITALGFQVKAINIPSGKEYSYILDLGSQKTAVVRFLAAANYQTLADNLAVALGKKEFAEKIKINHSSLEYLDLRFTNKVYYKFSDKKTENASHPVSATSQ